MAKLAHLLEKLASAAEQASLEKQAMNAHDLMRALRTAHARDLVSVMSDGQPTALPKMLHNIGKRNAAVKKVMPSRSARALEASKKFSDLAEAHGVDEIAALASGGKGLKGSLAKAFKERAVANNRIPSDVFQYEKSPAGVIDSISNLKKLEDMKYPGHSAY